MTAKILGEGQPQPVVLGDLYKSKLYLLVLPSRAFKSTSSQSHLTTGDQPVKNNKVLKLMFSVSLLCQ